MRRWRTIQRYGRRPFRLLRASAAVKTNLGGAIQHRCNPTSVQTLFSRPQFRGRRIDRNGPRGGRWPARLARVPRVVSTRTFLKTSKSEQCMLQNYCPRVFPCSSLQCTNAVAPTGIPHRKNKNHCTVSHINEARPLFESKCI